MIRAEHIVKSFDGRVVLNDISADFAPGITNLIIGQSGSGKTVLLKSLVGLHKIDSGNIYYLSLIHIWLFRSYFFVFLSKYLSLNACLTCAASAS